MKIKSVTLVAETDIFFPDTFKVTLRTVIDKTEYGATECATKSYIEARGLERVLDCLYEKAKKEVLKRVDEQT